MIQVIQDTQWRWLNRWRNRSLPGIDAIEMEPEMAIVSGACQSERTAAINRFHLLPAGYVVELCANAEDASGRR